MKASKYLFSSCIIGLSLVACNSITDTISSRKAAKNIEWIKSQWDEILRNNTYNPIEIYDDKGNVIGRGSAKDGDELVIIPNGLPTNMLSREIYWKGSIEIPADSSAKSEEDRLYLYVEKMPQHEGGNKAMLKSIDMLTRKLSLRNKRQLHDMVTIRFIIEKNGEITNAYVEKGKFKELNEEALMIVEKVLSFYPAQHHGAKRRVVYSVNFHY